MIEDHHLLKLVLDADDDDDDGEEVAVETSEQVSDSIHSERRKFKEIELRFMTSEEKNRKLSNHVQIHGDTNRVKPEKYFGFLTKYCCCNLCQYD